MAPASLEALRQRIETAIAGKEFAQAARLLTVMLEDHKGDDSLEYFANKLLSDPELSMAVSMYIKQDATQIMKAGPRQLATVGSIIKGKGRWADATPFYQLALQANEKDTGVMAGLLETYINSGATDKARELAGNYAALMAAAEPGKVASVYKELAAKYNNLKNYTAAKECIDRAIATNPGDWTLQLYNMAILQALQQYHSALKAGETALSLLPRNGAGGKGMLYSLMGEICDNQYLPSLAREYYEKAADYADEAAYAYHNLAAACHKLGDFRKGNEYLAKAFASYAAEYQRDKKFTDTGKYFFYADLIGTYKHPKSAADFDLWEELLTTYVEQHSTLEHSRAELFKMLLARKNAIINGQLYADKSEKERTQLLEATQSRMMLWFDRANNALKQFIQTNSDPLLLKDAHMQLGKLYLSFEMYEEAGRSFDAALQIDPRMVKALEGNGVTCFRTKRYAEAIRYFREALALNPSSLNAQCNLADSYRANGDTEQAELIYQAVLNRSPGFIDALVGLGECCKAAGDSTARDKDTEEAGEYFTRARSYFQKALQIKDGENPSKRLTLQEQDALYYSLAYTEVRLFEVNRGREMGLLSAARRHLRKVNSQSADYIKAQRALRQIGRRNILSRSHAQFAPMLIFVLALFLFAWTQFGAIRNYFSSDKTYVLDSKALLSAGARLRGQDSLALINSITPLLAKDYQSLREARAALSASVQAKYLPLLSQDTIAEMPSAGKFDNLSYGLFTFGSLLFMVVGLYLPQLTRMKVGSIEMEKGAVDTVKVTTSLIQASSPPV